MKISNKILIVVIAVIGLYAAFLIASDINTISSKLLSNNFTIPLGRFIVLGCNRIPSPAAKIIAFILELGFFINF